MSSVGVIQVSPTGISLWMGGHDSITEGGWEWTDGSPFRYVRWSAGAFQTSVMFLGHSVKKRSALRSSFSLQVTPITTLAKTVFPSSSTTATGMTITVRTGEGTSAREEVRCDVPILAAHRFNLWDSFAGRTPEPPPPHDGTSPSSGVFKRWRTKKKNNAIVLSQAS